MTTVSDYIKQRLTPTPPDFSQYRGQAKPTPMLGEVRDVGMPQPPTFMQQQYRGRVIPTPPQRTEAPTFANMADQDSWKEMPEEPLVSKVKGGADPYEALLENYYQESKDDLERRRKASMLGDLAQLFGQSVNLGIGARQFNPIKSNTAQYTGALHNLQDAYRRYGLSYRMRQILANQEADRQGRINAQKAKLDMQLENLRYKRDMGKIDKEYAYKREQELMKQMFDLDKGKREHDYRMNERKYTQDRSDYRASKYGGGKGSTGKQPKTFSVRLNKEDGTPYSIHIPEEQKGYVISLYKDMQKIAKKNPEKYGTLDDIKLGIGEGGTQESKMFATVVSRIHEFPELYPALESIMQKAEVEQPDAAQQPAKEQQAPKKGASLLPQIETETAPQAAAQTNPKGSLLPMAAQDRSVTPEGMTTKPAEKPQGTHDKYSSLIKQTSVDRHTREADEKVKAFKAEQEKTRNEHERYLAAKKRTADISKRIQDFNNFDIEKALGDSDLTADEKFTIRQKWRDEKAEIERLQAENAELNDFILQHDSKPKKK